MIRTNNIRKKLNVDSAFTGCLSSRFVFANTLLTSQIYCTICIHTNTICKS